MFNSIYLEQTVTGELSSDETQGQNSAKTSASGSSEDLEGESGDRVTNTTPSSNTSSEITPNPLVSTPSILIQPESTFSVITLQPEETLSSQYVLQQSTNGPSTISQQPVSTSPEKVQFLKLLITVSPTVKRKILPIQLKFYDVLRNFLLEENH